MSLPRTPRNGNRANPPSLGQRSHNAASERVFLPAAQPRILNASEAGAAPPSHPNRSAGNDSSCGRRGWWRPSRLLEAVWLTLIPTIVREPGDAGAKFRAELLQPRGSCAARSGPRVLEPLRGRRRDGATYGGCTGPDQSSTRPACAFRLGAEFRDRSPAGSLDWQSKWTAFPLCNAWVYPRPIFCDGSVKAAWVSWEPGNGRPRGWG